MVHLLIVDDEPNVASSLALRLQRTGYQTTIANSGQAALDALRAATFDLALLDLNLGNHCSMGWRSAATYGRVPPTCP